MDISTIINEGHTSLGIELGSTRIKGVLLDENHEMLAQGGFSWENRLENGIWTYHMDEVWTGLQACFAELKANVKKEYDVELNNIGAIGISAMMHGYMAFNTQGELLVPFRTWRNTMTGEASKQLTELMKGSISFDSIYEKDGLEGLLSFAELIEDIDAVEEIFLGNLITSSEELPVPLNI